MTHREMFGSAQWIGADGSTRTPCFRSGLEADRPREAVLTVCGLGHFAFWINGQRVGDDLFVPAVTDYAPRPITVQGEPFDEEMRHSCLCLRYDVTALLRDGRNELAAALGPGFFATETYSFDGGVSYGEVRLCFRLQWTDGTGAEREAVSGDGWRWRQGETTECTFFQRETQDLRLLPPDWPTAPFDGWEPVRLLPPLETEYRLQDCPTDGEIRLLSPDPVREFAVCTVYDAGENVSGWVVLEDCGRPGDRITVEFSEALSPEGYLHEHFRHGQRWEIVSGGRGRIVHPLWTWFGFRYFSVRGPAKVLRAAVVHSRVAVTSSFRSSDRLLNWLYDAYLRTQLGNLHGGLPSDCPHLERRGYTGDGQLTCETALLTLDYAAFLRKWMRDIADCQDMATGHVQYTAPYTRCGGGPGGWGCAIITVPYRYWRSTGDAAPLREMLPGMLRYIEYLRAHSENGLVTSDRPGEWCLGDWCAPGRSRLDPPFVNTCFLIGSVRLLEEIHAALRLPAPAFLAEAAWEAEDAVMRAYYDPETGSFCGGEEGADSFAVDCGIGDGRTWERLVERYERLGRLDTGIFGTEQVLRLLCARGQAPLAYRLMTSRHASSFRGWMEAGATTLWEYWPGDAQRSLNHPMFGACVKELFTSVLGIRQAEGSAGWREAVIEPLLTREVPQAEGGFATPLGQVRVSYMRQEEGVRLTVRVPEGMRATLLVGGSPTPLPAGESAHLLPL